WAVAPRSAVWPTTRGGFTVRSMRLMLSLSPVAPPARPATTAKAPFDATSSTMGRTPAVMSRLVYSTLVPSIESTEILLSLLRETSAVLPSGVIATMPPPAALPPTSTVPAGVTFLPSMVKTDTEPSTRLETSASVPCRFTEMPAAPMPASSVAMTFGGVAFRSMTVTRLSGVCFVLSLGSTLFEAVTSARLSSGITAMLSGGPTTLTGAWTSPITLGGDCLRSISDTVSGGGLGTTVTTPFTLSTLLSLPDTASCAPALTGSVSATSSARPSASGGCRRTVMASSRNRVTGVSRTRPRRATGPPAPRMRDWRRPFPRCRSSRARRRQDQVAIADVAGAPVLAARLCPQGRGEDDERDRHADAQGESRPHRARVEEVGRQRDGPTDRHQHGSA